MECKKLNGIYTKKDIDLLVSDINKTIEKYLSDEIEGFYFFGSLFNGDYIEDISDIDFIAVLKKPLNEETTKKVSEFFNELNSINPLAKTLEGSFTYFNNNNPWEVNDSIWKEQDKDIICEPDVLEPDLVEFIVGKGFTVYGEKPQKVLPYVSTKDLSDFSEKYIDKVINSINNNDNINSKILYKRLLNSCRSAYFLVNENFAERKTAAANYIMSKYPKYAYLIENALNNRNKKLETKNISGQELKDIKELLSLMKTNDYSSKIGFQKPMRLEIQMTTVCNCNCPQCGYFTINKRDNITSEYINTYLETVKDSWGWIDRVLFEGGEPTMDFEKLIECIRNAKKIGIPNIQINSNFINLDEEKINTLVKEGCNYFEISVDGASKEQWSLMRGFKENNKLYEKFLNNLSYACSLPGVAVDFNFTPTKLNIDEFDKVYLLACELGARFFSFQNLVCATKTIKDMEVPNEILIEKLKSCEKYKKIYSSTPTILLCCLEAMNNGKELLNNNTTSEQFKCSCGEKYLYLNHKGDMRMCCFGDGLVIGNFDKEKFNETWCEKTSDQFTGCPVLKLIKK